METTGLTFLPPACVDYLPRGPQEKLAVERSRGRGLASIHQCLPSRIGHSPFSDRNGPTRTRRRHHEGAQGERDPPDGQTRAVQLIEYTFQDGLYGNAQISEQREDNLLIDGFAGLYLVKPPFCQNAVPSLITDASTPKIRRVLATACTILEMEVSGFGEAAFAERSV